MSNLYVIYVMNNMIEDCTNLKLDIIHKTNVKTSKQL